MPKPRLDVHIILRLNQGTGPDPPDMPRKDPYLLNRFRGRSIRGSPDLRICINGSLSLQLILKMHGGHTIIKRAKALTSS